MSKAQVLHPRTLIDVRVLDNQKRDMEKVKVATGKTLTDQIGEALAMYHQMLRKAKVL